MNFSSSADLFAAAQRVIPGGVNSPVRAFGSVGSQPLFIARGEGSRLWDVEGREYVDYVGSWGPLILGHAHPDIVAAICVAAKRGTTYGAPTAAEVEMAQVIARHMPSIEMVRLVSSGTEATMTAVRLARAFTGRDKIVKFAGCYHGHSDAFLVKAGSGAATLGIPNSKGVAQAVAAETLTAEYNDIAGIEHLFAEHGHGIAAVIVEPVCGNTGLIPPAPGYLPALRDLTRRMGTMLIFDEVITGFRLGLGGAQGLYGIKPDLTTLGKIIGGGLPIGAVGGRADVMRQLAPLGPVYQAGTLSGNPVAVAAGLATLRLLRPDTYSRLEALSVRLETGMRANLSRLGLPYQYQRLGSMHCLFFTDRPVQSDLDTRWCDTAKFAVYFRDMLGQGIYLPPSQFETLFVSAAHSEADIDCTIAASHKAFQRLAGL
jgi:glutamate-1-semialdehyde 2,1-aminomutase